MTDIKITSAQPPKAVGNVQIGNETYTKMSDGSVFRYNPNQKHLPGEVTRFENSQAADVFMRAAMDKEAQKGDLVVKPKAGMGKKIGSAVASAFLPGLGQAANGQWGKALGFFFGVSVADVVGFVLGGPIGMSVAHSAVGIWNIVDAYKNAN